MEENLELEQDIENEIDVETDDDSVDSYDVDEIEETAEDNTDPEEEEPSPDDELEYDEDGNVITTEDGKTDAETISEDVDTSNTADNSPNVSSDYEDLKKKFDDREAFIKDALKVLGIDEKSTDEGIAKLIADAEGSTVEDVLKKRSEALQAEEAQKYYKQMLLDRMIANDMKELHSLFPETKNIDKFENVPNARRYAELRDLGLTVAEAYNAANPNARREAIASSVRQQSINASKAHLKSTVPIAAKDTSIKISRAEMDAMRDLFPDKSDKEIVALYKKTK